MGNIVLLDELTINKIAAGEVIERPASVVKEMVENSIDAGANKIIVETKNGGISYIKISDNGKGIARDDVEMAFERHATSKIRNAKDLDTVSSMGFRGEALASIASVAKVTLKTKSKDEDIGSQVIIEGGDILENKEIGFTQGTQIEVKELFYNTQVRYKFLKKDSTECGYIEDVLTNIALIHPEISIKFINAGKKILQTSGSGKLEDVIYSIYGKEIAQNMIPLDYTYDGIEVSGMVGKPIIARSNRSKQIYFVNGRYIKDQNISQAIAQVYKGIIPIGKFGFVILNIKINNLDVDVNVHPAKLEVRFSNPNLIFQAVYHSIKNTLLQQNLISEVEDNLKEDRSKTFEERLEKIKERNPFYNNLRSKEKIKDYVDDESDIKTNSLEEPMDRESILDTLISQRNKLDTDIRRQRDLSNIPRHHTYKPEKTLSSLDVVFRNPKKEENKDEKQDIKQDEKINQGTNVEDKVLMSDIAKQDIADIKDKISKIDEYDLDKLDEEKRNEITKKVNEYLQRGKNSKYDKYIEEYYANKKDRYDNLIQQNIDTSRELETKFKEDYENNSNKLDEKVDEILRDDKQKSLEQRVQEVSSVIEELVNPKEDESVFEDVSNDEVKEKIDLGEYLKKYKLENGIEDSKSISIEDEKEKEEQEEQKENERNIRLEELDNKIEKLDFLNDTIEKIQKDPNSINLDFKDRYEKMFGTKIKTPEEIRREENAKTIVEKQKASDIIKNISMFDDEIKPKTKYKVVGVFFNTYIIIEIEDEIYIIDQHAAHERINYEKVKENFYKEKNKDSQMLLMPDVIELTTKEYDIARDNWDLFESAGFTLEIFGENTIRLLGCPQMLMDLNTRELFLETLDEINTVARTAKQEREEKFIATVACKASVKAKMALDNLEITALIDKLLSIPNPFSCPHGRPTAIKMSKGEVEKKFSRT